MLLYTSWATRLCSGFLLSAMSLCLYVPLYLCFYPLSLSLPNLTLNIRPADPPVHLSLSHPLPLPISPHPLSFQIRNSLLRLIFGWTSSFLIYIYISTFFIILSNSKLTNPPEVRFVVLSLIEQKTFIEGRWWMSF